VINPCCGLAVIFCGFISLLIGRETINIPEIFSGVHGFTGMTVMVGAKIIETICHLEICVSFWSRNWVLFANYSGPSRQFIK